MNLEEQHKNWLVVGPFRADGAKLQRWNEQDEDSAIFGNDETGWATNLQTLAEFRCSEDAAMTAAILNAVHNEQWKERKIL